MSIGVNKTGVNQMVKCASIMTLQPKVCFVVINLLEQFDNLIVVEFIGFVVENEVKHRNQEHGE